MLSSTGGLTVQIKTNQMYNSKKTNKIKNKFATYQVGASDHPTPIVKHKERVKSGQVPIEFFDLALILIGS